jgi:hypothetical protein
VSFVANVIRDKVGWYYEQARDTAADIQIRLLQQSGLEGDAALADYADVAALLAGTSDEATFTNYAVKTLTPVRTVQNANDRVLLGGAAPGTAVTLTWGSAGGAINNVLGKVLFVYVPVPGTSTTAQMIPLHGHDVSAQTDGTDLVLTLNIDGTVRVRTP